MLWTYSKRVPRLARRAQWTISFRYPEPIGTLRILVRDNHGADAFVHGEVFEHEYYDLPLAAPPATVLDLGANVGFATIYFARRYPRAALACVEPIPGNLRCLERNLELNSVRAKVFEAAVDVVDGRLWMKLAEKDSEHHVAKDAVDEGSGQLCVAAMSVASIVRTLKWNRIGLLKVDIEGHEARLLTENNSWLSIVDAICIECHDELPEAALREVVSSFGFLPPRRLPGVWLIVRPQIDAA